MMVNAIGEPDPFKVFCQIGKVVGSLFVLVCQIYGFKSLPYGKVVFSKLVECNVPSPQCGFRQIIYIYLLLQGKDVKVRKTVS